MSNEMNIPVSRLLEKIGAMAVEIDYLRQRNAELEQQAKPKDKNLEVVK